MRPVIRLTVAAAVLGLLAVSQADARGGGGGGGGFHFGGGFRHGGFVHRGFPIRHPLAARNLRQQRVANNLNNGAIWPGWWGGGWGDWGSGGYSYPPQQTTPVPDPPQIVVIHSDGNGKMTTAEANQGEVTLVPGCHAIANGYHCDTQ